MKQSDQVLRALQDAGSRGVHTFELRAAYIGNPSQRIAELEAAGHVITHTRERLHGKAMGTRYRLVETASARPSGDGVGQADGSGHAARWGAGPSDAVASASSPVAEPTLFDTKPQNAIYGEAA